MKKTVSIKKFVPAPRSVVYDTFTMYETYSALPLVLSSKLIEHGQGSPSNGIGAIREIKTPVGTLKETVTDCSRPEYWDYQFLEWPLSIPHSGGRMSFTEVPGGTTVHWQTSYDVPETLAWKVAAGGIALSNIILLKVLAHLIGNVALSRKDKD